MSDDYKESLSSMQLMAFHAIPVNYSGAGMLMGRGYQPLISCRKDFDATLRAISLPPRGNIDVWLRKLPVLGFPHHDDGGSLLYTCT